MYTQVANALAVSEAAVDFSQAVSMDGANAVVFSGTLLQDDGTTLTLQLQSSNDLENWEDVASASRDFTTPGYQRRKSSGIAEAYVRLSYTATGGTFVFSAGINTADM